MNKVVTFLLSLVFLAGCGLPSHSGPGDKHIRSCGVLHDNGPDDANYDMVYNCMSDRLLSCIPGRYELKDQFDFYILGVREESPMPEDTGDYVCDFYMEYQDLDSMKGENGKTRLHEYAGLSKTCSFMMKEIKSFESLNPVPDKKTNIFKAAFWELAFGIADHCEGSLVDSFNESHQSQ